MSIDSPLIHKVKANIATLTEAGRNTLYQQPQLFLTELEAAAPGPLRAADSGVNLEPFSGPQWPQLFAAIDDLSLSEGGHSQAHVLGRLNPELDWLSGHFPGQPVLPGVVQTHWAGLLGVSLLNIQGEFCGLNVVKFQQIMQPGRAFLIRLEYLADKATLKFQYHGTEGFFSQGRIGFTAASDA